MRYSLFAPLDCSNCPLDLQLLYSTTKEENPSSTTPFLSSPFFSSVSFSYRILLLFAFPYALSMLYRTLMGTLEPSLSEELGLDSLAVGYLASAYFLSFGLCQLPLGILLDRYGAKPVQVVLVSLAALGAFLFAKAESLNALFLARLLVGIGVSACFMAGLKALKLCVSSHDLPLATGIFLSVGAFGALCAGTPADLALNLTGWRDLNIGLAALTLLAALCVAYFVPNNPFACGEKKNLPRKKQKISTETNIYAPTLLQDLKRQVGEMMRLFHDPRFFIPLPFAAVAQAAVLGIHGLWLPAWVSQGLQKSTTTATQVVSTAAFGLLCGFCCMGLLASFLQKRYHLPLMTTPAVCAFLFCLVQILLLLPSGTGLLLLCAFLFGLFGAGITVAYAALAANFDARLTGRVNTSLNFCVFALSFFFQVAIGGLSQLLQRLLLLTPEKALQHAMSASIVFQLLALGVSFLLWRRDRHSERIFFGDSSSSTK